MARGVPEEDWRETSQGRVAERPFQPRAAATAPTTTTTGPTTAQTLLPLMALRPT